jgi:DNA ligase (NAD+)
MTEDEAKAELTRLRDEIAYHATLYHTDDAPVISDAQYDELMKRNGKLEAAFPHLVLEDSPSVKVGALPDANMTKIAHRVPMLSLDNAFTEMDMADYLARIKRFLGLRDGANLAMVSEFKWDGLSCSLRYENHQLVYALTRGDGTIGEDVTANIRHVAGVPQTVPTTAPALFEVRGEVMMPKSVFMALNASQEAGRIFANPRNAAAGSLRQKDASQTAKRGLCFVPHGIGEWPQPPSTWTKIADNLTAWGFNGAAGFDSKFHHQGSVAEIMEVFQHVETIRASLPFDIDGLVHKVDELALRWRLGQISRTPRWAIAHKFPAEQAVTTLERVDVQIGRTGKVTPVARITPINVGGVLVSNTTLHNYDRVIALDLREGDKVVIQRAGDVIPQLVRICSTPEEHDQLPLLRLPTDCPICNSSIVRAEGEADSYCSGGLHCEAQIVERLKHAAGKDALDIDYLGDQAIREFHAAGYLNTLADIFRLHQHRDDLLKREGWGESSVNQLLRSIEQARNTTVNRALVALGIRHIGRTVSVLLALNLGTIDGILAKAQELFDVYETAVSKALINGLLQDRAESKGLKAAADELNIPGIGPEIVGALLIFVNDKINMAIARDLWSELTIAALVKPQAVQSEITGKTIVFTGSFTSVSRDEAKAQAERLGAKPSGSVSAKTDILVAGPGAGDKLRKAQTIPTVRILNEDEWLAIVDKARLGVNPNGQQEEENELAQTTE